MSSLTDGLPQSEIDYQLAHINQNNGTSVAVVGTLFTVLGVVAVALRLVFRYVKGTKLASDDYLAIASLIPLIALDSSAYLLTNYGVGRHLLWVAQHGPQNFIKIGKVELVLSVGYNFTMLLAKGAVLALYARVFTLETRWMRYGIISTGVVTVVYFVSSTLSIFLECRPLSKVWTEGCTASHGEAVTFAAINLVTDVALLALPQRVIWRLNRAWTDRLALSAIFLLGIFALAVTIVRLVALDLAVGTSHPLDPVYYATYTVTFTVLEPAIVVLCGSLPMLPGLIRASTRSKHRSSLRSDRRPRFVLFSRKSRRTPATKSYDPNRSSEEAIRTNHDLEHAEGGTGSMELSGLRAPSTKGSQIHAQHEFQTP